MFDSRFRQALRGLLWRDLDFLKNVWDELRQLPVEVPAAPGGETFFFGFSFGELFCEIFEEGLLAMEPRDGDIVL